MKIAIASSGLGHVARGIEAWAAELARALSERGLDVSLYKGGGKITAAYEKIIPCCQRDSVRTRQLLSCIPSSVGWRIGLGSAYQVEQTTFALSLLQHLRKDGIDLLHVQDPLLALIVQRARRLGWVRTRTLLAHGTEEPASFLAKLDYVQHLAPWHEAQARAAGVCKPAWTTIPNFVDTEQFYPGSSDVLRDELEIPRDALVVLSVAAIKRQHKRIDFLLDEFARLRRARPELPAWLVVAGGHELETDALIARGRQLLGNRVRFLVRFPRERMPELYRSADFFALASLKEMMPLALLEATASGLPCVVNDHPIFRWITGSSGTAIDLVKTGSLADAMQEILGDAGRRAQQGGLARQHCVENFSRDRVVDQIVGYYQRVLPQQTARNSVPYGRRKNDIPVGHAITRQFSVSVIIPTFNSASLVTQAIDSVLAQTTPPAEILVVDDGSQDDTRAKLERYAGRIRYIYQENQGVSAARNRGLREAQGNLIAFLDADDVWHPRKLEIQQTILYQNPNLGMLGAAAIRWPECVTESASLYPLSPVHRGEGEGEGPSVKGPQFVEIPPSLHRPSPQPSPPSTGEREKNRHQLYHASLWLRQSFGPREISTHWRPVTWDRLAVRNYFIASSVVIRKSLLDRIGGFDPTLQGPEDYDLWLRAAALSTVGNVSHGLIGYRSLPGSLSKQAERMEAGMRQIVRKLDAYPSWLLRRKASAYCDYSCAYMYSAAGQRGRAIGRMIRSLLSYPLPFNRSEMPTRWARIKRLAIIACGIGAPRESAPTRIVHVVLSLDCGGLERVILDLVRSGKELAQDVSILCLERPGMLADQARSLGARVLCVEKKPGFRPGVLARLASAIRELKPDIVHTHQLGALFYAGPAARLVGVKQIVHTQHGRQLNLSSRARLVARLAGRFAGRIFCVSQDIADQFVAGGIAPARKIAIVRNGIDIASVQVSGDAASSTQIPAGVPVVGAIGRLSEVKQHHVLLKAFAQVVARVPTAHLLIVGDGPMRPGLESLSARLGLTGQAHFLGYQSQPEQFLNRMNVLALTSRSEGLPLAVLEAWAAGLPVVASRVGGVPELITHGQTGLLFDAGNVDELAQALCRVISDPQLATCLGEAGRRRVEAQFTRQRMAQDYQGHYLAMAA